MHEHAVTQLRPSYPVTCWSRTFPATPDQVRQARRFLAAGSPGSYEWEIEASYEPEASVTYEPEWPTPEEPESWPSEELVFLPSEPESDRPGVGEAGAGAVRRGFGFRRSGAARRG